MPTGYTARIADGITFEEYALGCARAFGALVEMRDEPSSTPIPESFTPSSWHKERLAESRAKLNAINAMSNDACDAAASSAHSAALENHNKSLRERLSLKAKYDAMLRAVEAYTPPSPDHIEYKNFMREQIVRSMDADCDTSYMTVPQLVDGATWRKQEIEVAQRGILYHTDQNEKEIERVALRNKWIADLRKSLGRA